MATINEVQLTLQNLLERTVSQVEIGKALGTGRGNISARIKYKSKIRIELRYGMKTVKSIQTKMINLKCLWNRVKISSRL